MTVLMYTVAAIPFMGHKSKSFMWIIPVSFQNQVFATFNHYGLKLQLVHFDFHRR